MSRTLPGEPPRACAMGVLADGLGGMSGGAMAAENVILTSRRRFAEFSPEHEAPEGFFDSLIDEIHTVLRLTGMTTGANPHSTFAAVLMQPDRVDWCHVGDSRIYHIRNRKLMHCTSDHTYAAHLVASGKAKAERARLHPHAHKLVYALGAHKPPSPTLGSISDPQPGDTFLICSDGLWNYFHAGELVLVTETMPLREAASTLIERARQRAHGRGDNCSLAILRYLEA
jgi:serine/threonine protein phosphatase PrpC